MRPDDNLTIYNVGNYDYAYDNRIHKIHSVKVIPVLQQHIPSSWRTGVWGEVIEKENKF